MYPPSFSLFSCPAFTGYAAAAMTAAAVLPFPPLRSQPYEEAAPKTAVLGNNNAPHCTETPSEHLSNAEFLELVALPLPAQAYPYSPL